jgi:hypothetical protein
MHAVVNTLTFRDPIDPGLFPGAESLLSAMRSIDGFAGVQIVQTTETEAVLIITADSPATLDRIATEVGSPWMVEHVVPLLAGPPDRKIGTVAVSAGAH